MGSSTNENGSCINAHVVLLARGDFFADALSAAVLSVHNGRWSDHFDDEVFPIVLTQNPSTLGTPVTGFLNKAGRAISGLDGQAPANGRNFPIGFNNNEASSSVFTIQPIGGPVALTPALLSTAIKAVTAG